MDLAPTLILADEPAQWEASKADKMIAALRTSMGKIPNARLIALGTQPDNADNWFSSHASHIRARLIMFKSMKHPRMRRHFARLHGLKPILHYPTCPHWKARYARKRQRARRDVMELASFKALRLNQPVSDVLESLLIEASTWRGIEAPEPPEIQAGYVLGLDLGTSRRYERMRGILAAYWCA